MNSRRQQVTVPRVWIGKSIAFGKALVEHYAAGGSPMSRSRSGNRGTEKNPLRLAHGKVGECAFALYCGLDPGSVIKFDVSYADPGWDITLLGGARVDVKTTFQNYKLIWSNNVNDLYEHKQFDALVSVTINQNDFSHCWIEGFVLKTEFLRRKTIADGKRGLESGTWFMDKGCLDPIDQLLHLDKVGWFDTTGSVLTPAKFDATI